MALRKQDIGKVSPLDNLDLQWWLDELATLVREMRALELLNGHLIKDIAITAGTTKKVAHKLGRVPNGYLVVKKNANSVVYDSAATTPSRELWLDASANVTISIWVF